MPSSWEFQQLAQASLDAADVAFADIQRRDQKFIPGSPDNEFTFMVITVAFLYFRGVELALKAAIRERTLATPEEIRSSALGHNLTALLNRALSAAHPFTLPDLGLDHDGKVFIERWSEDYANKWFEYHFGPWDIPNPARCQEVATSVIRSIEPIARTLPEPGIL